MEWSLRKILTVAAVTIFCVALPFILCSSWSLTRMQTWVEKNPRDAKAPGVLFNAGRIYMYTLRQDRGSVAFSKYIELFKPGDPPENPTPEESQKYRDTLDRYAQAMFNYAMCLDEWSNSIVGALPDGRTAYDIRCMAREGYEKYREKYPEHPDNERAEKAMNRLNLQLR